MSNTNTNTQAVEGTYEYAINSCHNAVRQDINTVNKWLTCGRGVHAFFGSEAALLEQKAQFIADAILPAIDKRHAKALEVDLVRKNSKEFIAYDQHERNQWEAANQAKKDARATCDTYFARIVKYAFPKEATPSESVSLKTKIQNQIADLVKKCEKSTDADFDVVATMQALNAVLTTVNK